MCIVSAVIDSTWKQAPPINTWNYQTVVDMSEVLKKLEQIDKKLGNKDCIDEKKEQFLRELKERLDKLEQEIKDIRELCD